MENEKLKNSLEDFKEMERIERENQYFQENLNTYQNINKRLNYLGLD